MARPLMRIAFGRNIRGLLPLALIAPLVACTLASVPPGLIFEAPNVVSCDIEQPAGRHCATAADLDFGIRLAAAAEALVSGQTSTVGIDDSPAALGRCAGAPEAIEFEGPFPQGTGICLD